MSAPVRHCGKHNVDFRGTCRKCHPRRSASRPSSRRAQSAVVLSRLPLIEPRRVIRDLVTTSTFVSRYLDRSGISAEAMTAAEWVIVFRRADQAAERYRRRFGPHAPAGRAREFREVSAA